MADNASNNSGTFISKMQRLTGVNFHESRRLRCAGHIINLVVKAIIYGEGVSHFEREDLGLSEKSLFDEFRKLGVVGKLHNFVRSVTRSHKKVELFEELQTEAKREKEDQLYANSTLSLMKDGGVRWNSVYHMLKRCLQLKDAVDLFFIRYDPGTDEYDTYPDRLSDSDWIEVRKYVEFLGYFHHITLYIEGNGSYGCLFDTVVCLNFLHKEIERAVADTECDPADSFFRNAVRMGQQKLNTYWEILILEDAPSYYAAATILHPEYRHKWFQYQWSRHPLYYKKAEKSIWAIWDNYVKAEEASTEEPIVEGEPSRRKIPDDVAHEFKSRFLATQSIDPLFMTGNSGGKRKGRKRVRRSDLEDYLMDEPCAIGTIKDPIEWWRTIGKREYPTLCKLAIDLLAIPATSCECERVFSQAGKLVTDERNRLGPEIIEAIELQKDWLRKRVIESPLLQLVGKIERLEKATPQVTR
jgi:hAT family C-terminal dimerisation region